MAQPTRTRALLRVDVLKKLDPVSEPKTSSTTSGGSTTTLLDSLLAPAAESEDFVGDWIYIAEKQGSGPEVGEIARVTAVDFSGSNSTLTLAPALTATLETGADYERHRKVRPNIINDRLDVILGLLRQNVLLPVTVIEDGDMETSGVGSWTAALVTLTKDTTFVRRGRFSLKVETTSLDGHAVSEKIFLPPGTVCIVETDVYITEGDSFKIVFRDSGNTDIGTPMESDESGWVHLEGLFTVPADSTYQTVLLFPQTNTDIVYVDHVTVWPVADQGIDLPDFLEFVYDVESLFYLPLGTGLTGSTNVGAYRINESTPQLYAHYQRERDDTGVVSARFYVEGRKPSNALWLKGRKPYLAFAGATDALKDADTTQAHKNVVVNMTTASILDDLALDATEDEKPALANGLQERALLLRHEIQHILANMTPPVSKKITTPFTRKRV